MFKNKAFQVKMVNDTSVPAVAEPKRESPWTPDAINKITQDNMRTIATGLVAVYAVKVLVDALSEIAINKTNKND